MLQQCGAVKTASHEAGSGWLLTHCWLCLRYATRYKLDKLKDFAIATVAADKGMLEKEEHKEGKLWWDKALGKEVVEAALKLRG